MVARARIMTFPEALTLLRPENLQGNSPATCARGHEISGRVAELQMQCRCLYLYFFIMSSTEFMPRIKVVETCTCVFVFDVAAIRARHLNFIGPW